MTSMLILAISLLVASWSFQNWKSARNDLASNVDRLEKCHAIEDAIQAASQSPESIPVIQPNSGEQVVAMLGQSGRITDSNSREVENSGFFLCNVKLESTMPSSLTGVVEFLRSAAETGIVPLSLVLQGPTNIREDATSDLWRVGEFRFMFATDASVE